MLPTGVGGIVRGNFLDFENTASRYLVIEPACLGRHLLITLLLRTFICLLY